MKQAINQLTNILTQTHSVGNWDQLLVEFLVEFPGQRNENKVRRNMGYGCVMKSIDVLANAI